MPEPSLSNQQLRSTVSMTFLGGQSPTRPNIQTKRRPSGRAQAPVPNVDQPAYERSSWLLGVKLANGERTPIRGAPITHNSMRPITPCEVRDPVLTDCRVGEAPGPIRLPLAFPLRD